VNKIKLCCGTIAWKGEACAERPPKTQPAAISSRFVSAGSGRRERLGSARLGSARLDSARFVTVRHGSAQHGSGGPPGPAARSTPRFAGRHRGPPSLGAQTLGKIMGFCCCRSHSWCLLRNDGFFSFHLFFFFFFPPLHTTWAICRAQ